MTPPELPLRAEATRAVAKAINDELRRKGRTFTLPPDRSLAKVAIDVLREVEDIKVKRLAHHHALVESSGRLGHRGVCGDCGWTAEWWPTWDQASGDAVEHDAISGSAYRLVSAWHPVEQEEEQR